MKAAVLSGGVGEEREVSLESGRCVAGALGEAGVRVVTADIGPEDTDILGDETVDVFFLALHGRFGEDGQLQRMLEERSLAYTGSGPAASKLAFDKMASKGRFIEAGVNVPKAIAFNGAVSPEQIEQQLGSVHGKYVVKPIRQGSSVGVEIVTGAQEAVDTAKKCESEFGECMIEQYISGREVTVGILCEKALPIIEIRPTSGFYNYHAKYVDEHTEFVFDTIDDAQVREQIEQAALRCFEALGLKDFARVDFILGENDVAYVLEVNTIPGFTTHSLLPMAAARAGISMSRLCGKIVEAALQGKKAGGIAENRGIHITD